MKHFRQKKRFGGASKSKSTSESSSSSTKKSSSSSTKKKSTKRTAKCELEVVQDPFELNEQLLKQFDMNMAFGPCTGMSRLDRWQRAKALGLNPPEEVWNLLKDGKHKADSLWHDLL